VNAILYFRIRFLENHSVEINDNINLGMYIVLLLYTLSVGATRPIRKSTEWMQRRRAEKNNRYNINVTLRHCAQNIYRIDNKLYFFTYAQ